MVTSKKVSDEITVLNEQKGLYLQPYCRIVIKVHIPEIKGVGKSISNWEIMEKLRAAIQPVEFSQLKVDSITREMVAFEGELLTRQSKKSVIQTLNGKQLKLSGFSSAFTINASENKNDNYPTQQDWESFFADKDQSEFGERPDTVVIDNLPCYWFMDTNDNNNDHKPNQDIVEQVFNKFGPIRCLHIPLLDQYHKSIDNPFQTFSFNNQLNFKVFIQYQEYQGFCQAIQELKCMKLLYRLTNQNSQKKEMLAKIVVDFDKTAHLSSKNIRKRRFEKLKLQQLEKEAEEKAKLEQQKQQQLQKQQEDERKRLEHERMQHKLEQEKRAKEKQQEKIRLKNQRKQRRKEKRQALYNLKLQLQSELEQRRQDAEAKFAALHLQNKDRAKKLILYLLDDIASLHMEKVNKRKQQEQKRKQLADEKALRRRLIKKIKKQESRKSALKRELLYRQIDATSLKSVVVKK